MSLPVEDLAFEVHLRGPHVAVRIMHLPTGLVATAASDSLGQWRVKQQALAELERMVAEGSCSPTAEVTVPNNQETP